MVEKRLKAGARGIFRWYLNRFPLRDGKAYFYEAFHTHLVPPERYVTVTLDQGFTLKLDLEDAEQLKIYFFGHYHERYEAALIRRLLDPGEAFWDVGANVGYFSLVAATALENRGQVAAFEPGKVAYGRLVENISLNSFTDIIPYNLAVTDREGEARLYLSGAIADTGANLYTPGRDQSDSEVCRTVSVDEFLQTQGLSHPDFLKVDVEGAELAVLRGARKLLATAPPLLLLEMEEKNLQAAGTDRAAIQKLLTPLSYQAAFLRKGRWYVIEDVKEARGRNIFWFNLDRQSHRRKARRLPVHGRY